MPATSEKKRRDTVPPQADPAGNGQPHQFITASDLARLAGISGRKARKAAALALAGKPWRGAKLEIREGRGAGGKQYEVAVSSLPVRLQAKWYQQQPGADLREQIAHHIACIEEDRRAGRNGKRFINLPWTQEQREAGWAGFTRLPTSMQAEAKRRLEAVILFHSSGGIDVQAMQLCSFVADKFNVSPSTIRNWVGICRNLHRGDWVVALAPKYEGYQSRAPITPEAYEFIKAQYFTTSKQALKNIYWRASRVAAARGWTLPSYTAVRCRIKSEPHSYHVLKREGQDALATLYPPLERDYSTLKLHELWCGDGRKADLFCVWEDGTIGRPIVVAWLEVRSRVCLGYAVGKTESADLIRLAFKDAAEDSRALPEVALVDNGRGFASKLLTGASPTRYRFTVREEEVPGILTLLGVQISWALPYNGRSKPIESWWRTLANVDKRFPGAYCGNRSESKPEDCDPTKAVPIAQFRQALEVAIAEYHARPHRGDAMDGRSPREVYSELLAHTPVRHPTPEQLRLCMLAAELVKINRADGSVRVLDNRYWNEKLAQLPRDVTYVCRFDPEDATQPVAIYQGDKFICEVPLYERTGFRDQTAAKDHARAHRRYLKGLKEQAGAHRDMHKAATWITPPDVPDALQAEVKEAILPTPKVVTPLRPEPDYRPDKPEKPISDEERSELLKLWIDYDDRQRRAREG